MTQKRLAVDLTFCYFCVKTKVKKACYPDKLMRLKLKHQFRFVPKLKHRVRLVDVFSEAKAV